MDKPLILLASAMALAARADVRLYNGHADIGVGYYDGHLDLHVHQEEPFEAEYEPGEVTFVVGNAAKTLSPGGIFAPQFFVEMPDAERLQDEQDEREGGDQPLLELFPGPPGGGRFGGRFREQRGIIP